MSSSSHLQPAFDRTPYEVCGVESGLLGFLSSTSGVEMVATVGMLNNRIENLVTSDRILFGFTPRIPAKSAVSMNGKTLGSIGRLSFITPGASVTLHADGVMTSSACMLGRSFLADLVESERQLRFDDIDFIRAFDSAHLAYLGQLMFHEVISPGFGSSLFAESIGMAVALEIARYVHGRQPDHGIRRGGLAPWQMRRLDSYVHDNLAGKLSLSELARLLGVSVRHLSRVVKQTKGVSVHRWIADCRLEEARRLLSETSMPIQVIALRAAFTSAASFSTAFRATTGFSPGQFRRMALGEDTTRKSGRLIDA
jgi:AraC family transcriptional regulator